MTNDDKCKLMIDDESMLPKPPICPKLFNAISVLILILTVVFGFVFFWSEAKRADNYMEIALHGRKLSVYVADTSEKQAKGLAGAQKLTDDEGMLFIFDSPMIRTFWMKGMEMPIDIVWIRDHKVIDISAKVQPEPGVADADLKRYSPKGEVDAVLEVNAGWARKYGLEIGDEVEYNRLR